MKSTETIINPNPQLQLTHECAGHAGPIYAVDGDDFFIYTAAADKFVTRWNRETGQQDPFAIRCESSPFAIKLVRQKNILAIGLSNGHLHFIDLQKPQELHLYVQHQVGIFAMFEQEDKQQLFVGDADGFLSVWDTQSLKLKIILPLCSSKIRAITALDLGRIAIGTNEGEIIIIETEFMNEIHRFYAHELGVSSVCFEAKTRQLISGGKDGMLRWWQVEDFQILRALPAHKGAIYGIMNLNEQYMVTVSRDKSIKVWDKSTQHVVQKVEAKNRGHRHSVNGLWTDQNGTVATVGDDQLLRVFHWMSKI
jgi:WD40 repeat protein